MTVIPIVVSAVIMTPAVVMASVMALIMASAVIPVIHPGDWNFFMPSSTIFMSFPVRMLFASTVTPGIPHPVFTELVVWGIPPIVIHHHFIPVV